MRVYVILSAVLLALSVSAIAHSPVDLDVYGDADADIADVEAENTLLIVMHERLSAAVARLRAHRQATIDQPLPDRPISPESAAIGNSASRIVTPTSKSENSASDGNYAHQQATTAGAKGGVVGRASQFLNGAKAARKGAQAGKQATTDKEKTVAAGVKQQGIGHMKQALGMKTSGAKDIAAGHNKRMSTIKSKL